MALSGHLDCRTKSPLFGEERTPRFSEYTPPDHDPGERNPVLRDHAQAGSDLVHVRLLDHPSPFRDLGLDVGAELGRRDAGRLEAVAAGCAFAVEHGPEK